MAWARSHIQDAPDGSIFLADTLTRARGQHGRIWQIKQGQLLVTIALKPKRIIRAQAGEHDYLLQSLNRALVLGISEPLLTYGAAIKYPNDILFDTKKVCGLLIEPIWYAKICIGVVFGFGLNLNTVFTPDDPLVSIATSLYHVINRQQTEHKMLVQIFAGLNYWYAIWQSQDDAHIASRWLERTKRSHFEAI